MCKETKRYLLGMDDLKLFAPNEEKLAEKLKFVKWDSAGIQMDFGLESLDNCAKCTFHS